MMQHVAVTVTDSSQVGEARRAAASLAERARLNETQCGRVAIIITELGNNLVRYGKRGVLLIKGENQKDGEGWVEILSIDSGPGLDPSRCLVDGYSTGGTPGNGLGAVQRLATLFDIYSAAPTGTVIFARVTDGKSRKIVPTDVQWSSISLPAPGEIVCGDTWRFAQRNGSAAFMIADGLGHGTDAAAASQQAAMVFERDPFVETGAFIGSCHQAMMGTRGSAAAITNLDFSSSKLRFAGVGNISGTLFSNSPRQGLPSHNGIVGGKIFRVKSFEYALPAAGLLIMHSDGLQTRWTLDAYPGLARRHPGVIAGVLFRDFCRERDDITILVGGWTGGFS